MELALTMSQLSLRPKVHRSCQVGCYVCKTEWFSSVNFVDDDVLLLLPSLNVIIIIQYLINNFPNIFPGGR